MDRDIREQITRVLTEILEDTETLSTAEIILKIINISKDITNRDFKDLSDYEMLDILIEVQADLSI